MKIKLAIFLAIGLVVLGVSGLKVGEGRGKASSNSNFILSAPVVMATESLFDEEVIEEVGVMAFETETVVDVEKDACSEDEVRQEGQNGRRVREIKVIYYNGEEHDREILSVKVEESVTKVVAQGAKKVFKSMQTDSGTISYWCNLGRFKATAYDKNCPGCSATTSIGMPAGFGVVAVDSGVIPLGSRLYITGYGLAVAGDTGGGIKGREIDLGFDEIGSWWGRREVEVYLL